MIRPTRVLASATVLMPFDGSPQAMWTFPVARTLARLMEGTLHLVLSGEKDEARNRLSMLAEQMPEATLHELQGNPMVGILRLATCNRNAFIVTPAYVGDRPGSGLGPFPEELLRLAECPVLLVQPGTGWAAWKLTRILVPQDGSAGAARALCPATRLAERSGAELLILHVSPEQPPADAEPGAMEFPVYMDQPQHEWPSWVSGFLERVRHLCDLSPHTLLRFHWSRGDPGREIVALARRKSADLITLSWSHRQEPGRAQVVRQVIREASCPILVLP